MLALADIRISSGYLAGIRISAGYILSRFQRVYKCASDMDTHRASKDMAIAEKFSAAYKKDDDKKKATRSESSLRDFIEASGSFTSQLRPSLMTLNTYYKGKETNHGSGKSKFLDIDVFC
ncbi:hypothetical protein SADUNF_Sadunf04G0056100 [Salix dunnii]|uniref:Uncharacterized protein n=1 Tax=Salix dunnii TaxID=1413687 RepID=A0A835MYS3_9ROSI|nr:hypothetical protein SADUNF_Sadunf04G0056100 [Salix dunnii]